MIVAGKVGIIAEAGVNHNGDIDLAIELIDKAAAAGADFVKFQTFSAEKIASRSAGKAEYQKVTTGAGGTQFDMLKRLELSRDSHRTLLKHCTDKGIEFLSSAFDVDSVGFLADDLGLKRLKLGSGEMTNAPILLAAARSGMEVFLSTGMGSLAEVEEALGVIAFGMTHSGMPSSRADFSRALLDPSVWDALRARVTLLHCTTEYPAAVDDTNLHAIETMRTAFGLRVGYSDHTEGNAMSIAAVALGATMLEKHFTLDRTMEGPDHAASVEPDELAALVRDVRAVERGMGNGIKQPSAAEVRNRPIVRKTLLAARDLAMGHVIGEDDIVGKRTGGGVSTMDLWDCVGRQLSRAVARDEPISWTDLRWPD
jgi:N-acetylneuraminate synthase